MKSVITANYRRGTVHSACFPSVLYPQTESFPPEQLSSHYSKEKKKKHRWNLGLFSDSQRPWKHVCIFRCMCILRQKVSEAKNNNNNKNKPTDVNPAVCSPELQLTSFSFSPLLCVSGLHHCLLYPCSPRPSPPCPWNRSINNDSFLPFWLHAGTLKQEPEMQSKLFSVLYLSSTICDRQADRGACCRRNRNHCALCFGSESYLHYTFYKQIRRDTLLERIKGIG